MRALWTIAGEGEQEDKVAEIKADMKQTATPINRLQVSNLRYGMVEYLAIKKVHRNFK